MSSSTDSSAPRPRSWIRVCMQLFLMYHIIENLIFVSLAVIDLKTFSSPGLRLTTKYSSRLAVASYACFGLPIIVIGLWGIIKKAEKPVRFYLNYSMLSLVVNFAYTLDAIVHFVPCATGNDDSTLAKATSVFECGHPRGLMLLVLSFIIGIHAAMLYPVYSYCEDLKYDAEQVVVLAGEETKESEGKEALRMPTRSAEIASRWASLRKSTPLRNIEAPLRGEYGALLDTARVIGGSSTDSYLPAMRLV